MRFILNWLVNAAALWVAVELLSGLAVGSTETLFLAALVIGLVNAVVKPILLIVTIPITVLTLGIFYLVLNGFMLYLAAAITPGFTITNFGSAFLGALIVSAASTMLHLLIKGERKRES